LKCGAGERWKRSAGPIVWEMNVRNEEVLHRVEEMNIIHTVKRKKTNWIGHILRRNCLLKHGIEGKIEENRRRARRSGQVLGADLEEKR
jgi:ribosomal protein L35